MTTIPTADRRSEAALAAEEWTAPLRMQRPELILDYALGTAAALCGEARPHDSFRLSRDVAVATLQPGDGTRYDIFTTLLPPHVSSSLGYDLVVTLPGFGIGLGLDAHGYHTPGYIAEKAPNLHPPAVPVLAAFLTVLSAHLEYLRT